VSFSPPRAPADAGGGKLFYVAELERKVRRGKDDVFRLEAVVGDLRAELAALAQRCRDGEACAARLTCVHGVWVWGFPG